MAPKKKRQPAASNQSVPIPAVSAIVKSLRQRAGLTLNELAQRAEVAASTISKIESGQLSPGYEIIVRLARGLEVDVADLFSTGLATAPTGRRGITRSGQGGYYETAEYCYEVLANDVARKEFVSLRAKVKARSRADWPNLPSHEGEELLFVLSGRVALLSEHYEPLELEPGDSVYFDSRSGHGLISVSDEDADVLWICSHRDAMTRVEGSEP